MAIIYKIQDSFSGEILDKEDAHHIELTVNNKKWVLDFSADSLASFWEALDPFIRNEKIKTTKTSPTAITPEVRADIKAFAEQNNLGEVGLRGRIKKEIYEAWVEAGKPKA